MSKNKYRAWWLKEKRMLDVNWFECTDNPEGLVNCGVVPMLKLKEIVLMQCTGLLDKNKNHIYEGDILMCPVKRQNPKAPTLVQIEYESRLVEFIYGAFRQRLIGGCNSWVLKNYDSDPVDHQVIGNVYKNPRFLRGIQ